MAAPTKNQKIEALVKLVQKRCRGAGLPKPQQRSVFETLMYAALLENATFDKADLAFTVLENYYIDWNEIRVCSIRELADTLMDLPHPEAAAGRVRKALQGIFEKMYTFDLEELRKKGKPLADHIKMLESMSAGTPFMIQYTAQVALDGHLIPLDEASLRVMRRLGLSQLSSDGTQEICIGLDRVILKKVGITFAGQLHHFAAGFYDVPDSPELLSLLSAIDKGAVDRSWSAPVILKAPSASPHSETMPASSITASLPPVPVAKPVKGETPAVKTPVVKPATKPTVPSKEPVTVAKPAAKPKSAKPDTKSVSQKPSVKLPKRKSEQAKPDAKKASKPLAAKTMPGKTKPSKKVSAKETLAKKQVKATPTKKKMDAKKSPPKPVKKSPVEKVKRVSPTEALRKKKPK